ncbi:PREDICTED: cytochrome c oxidase assembly protein COX16 homolog, mitochondrial isoform X2 [Aptenodytes forsteri]|uniref:cytochrome c oxidase assembly protein COX16 homolog, mitochondrial isoform X2 n=1 Tax=Aptenodytes forsteri TaxID=9233 RepID=UPI00090552E2|nr:PREDICTED: cytochrome c oxidase assembly protein COX16 homolog, mitochondrial isoform X2 [Aptenodytes forsteri]
MPAFRSCIGELCHSDFKADPALKEKLKQNTVTLESEYEKLEKSDLDNWENIRGPRLWEDSRTVQKQRREALRLKRE